MYISQLDCKQAITNNTTTILSEKEFKLNVDFP